MIITFISNKGRSLKNQENNQTGPIFLFWLVFFFGQQHRQLLVA
jgi:hypothetical protein